jgi:hypothetical protein
VGVDGWLCVGRGGDARGVSEVCISVTVCACALVGVRNGWDKVLAPRDRESWKGGDGERITRRQTHTHTHTSDREERNRECRGLGCVPL